MLSRTEDPRGLGLFRCVFGTVLVVNVLSLLGVVDSVYGAEGISTVEESCGGWPARWSVLCTSWGSRHPAAVSGALVVSSVAFAMGFMTRGTKWTTLVLFVSFMWRSTVASAGDAIFSGFLVVLCLSPCGAALSVDSWLRARARGRIGRHRILCWWRWALVLQLGLILGVNGWMKSGGTWTEGSSFYYLAANVRWQRFDSQPLLRALGTNVLVLGTWAAWWFERLFPIAVCGVFARAATTRIPRVLAVLSSPRLWAGMLLLFMGTIAIFANVGWFVVVTAVAGICLFHGDEVGTWFDGGHDREEPSPPGPEMSWIQRGSLALLVVHTVAIVDGGSTTLAAGSFLPDRVAQPLHSWRRATHAHQVWRMFAPSAPTFERLLWVDYVVPGGLRIPAPDDRSTLLSAPRPRVLWDRHEKVHANVLSRARWRAPYARWLCRNRPPQTPAEGVYVELNVLRRPIPFPGALHEHGRRALQQARDQQESHGLLSVACPSRTAPMSRAGPG